MIRFRNWINYDYFIDPKTAVITDKNGIVQKTGICKGRAKFQGCLVYVIQACTAWGYKEGYVVHHIDGNSLNDSLDNLMYITKEEHSKLHSAGEKNAFYGKHHSKELLKQIGDKLKGRHWWHKGNEQCMRKECPGDGWVLRKNKMTIFDFFKSEDQHVNMNVTL